MRFAGGSVPDVTQASRSVSSARSAAFGRSGLRGCADAGAVAGAVGQAGEQVVAHVLDAREIEIVAGAVRLHHR